MTNEPIDSREAAVVTLNSAGLRAFARDWSFGKSVCVGTTAPDSIGKDITWLNRVFCIYPDGPAWAVIELSVGLPSTPVFSGSLTEATYFAKNALLAT
jgi:hypothetical protein